MSDVIRRAGNSRSEITRIAAGKGLRLPIMALGLSLGLFIAISFVLCVTFDLLVPGRTMYQAWQPLLPGFTWLTWPSFIVGLVESYAWGWYVAIVFGVPFNFFAARLR